MPKLQLQLLSTMSFPQERPSSRACWRVPLKELATGCLADFNLFARNIRVLCRLIKRYIIIIFLSAMISCSSSFTFSFQSYIAYEVSLYVSCGSFFTDTPRLGCNDVEVEYCEDHAWFQLSVMVLIANLRTWCSSVSVSTALTILLGGLLGLFINKLFAIKHWFLLNL